MTRLTDPRILGDLSSLPASAQGERHLVWWGNLGFMLIEGTGFALAIGSYLFLVGRSAGWPPPGDPLPGLGWSSAFTVGLLASEVPNIWVKRKTALHDASAVRWGVFAMMLIGLALLVLRGFEIARLEPSWHRDAYGSVVWMLMILHTSHILTEWGETLVQGLWLFTHRIGDDQFSDIEDSCNYWSFVVLAWLPLCTPAELV